MRNKIICIITVVMLVIALSGCGDKKEDTKPTATGDISDLEAEYGRTIDSDFDGGESAGIIIKNNSEELAATNMLITVYACDADGNVMQYRAGDQAYDEYGERGELYTTYGIGCILPGESSGLGCDEIFPDIQERPESIKIEFTEVKWEDPEDLSFKGVQLLDYDLDTETNILKVKVKNDSDIEYGLTNADYDLSYSIIAKNKEGEIVAGTTLMSESVPANSETEEKLELYWNRPDNFSPDHYEVFAVACYEPAEDE